jgi:hypothetical protein
MGGGGVGKIVRQVIFPAKVTQNDQNGVGALPADGLWKGGVGVCLRG